MHVSVLQNIFRFSKSRKNFHVRLIRFSLDLIAEKYTETPVQIFLGTKDLRGELTNVDKERNWQNLIRGWHVLKALCKNRKRLCVISLRLLFVSSGWKVTFIHQKISQLLHGRDYDLIIWGLLPLCISKAINSGMWVGCNDFIIKITMAFMKHICTPFSLLALTINFNERNYTARIAS